MSKLEAVRLPDELAERLNVLTEETGRSKSYYLKKALERYLEDQEDYLLAMARMEENNTRVSYDKMRKDLGLDD